MITGTIVLEGGATRGVFTSGSIRLFNGRRFVFFPCARRVCRFM